MVIFSVSHISFVNMDAPFTAIVCVAIHVVNSTGVARRKQATFNVKCIYEGNPVSILYIYISVCTVCMYVCNKTKKSFNLVFIFQFFLFPYTPATPSKHYFVMYKMLFLEREDNYNDSSTKIDDNIDELTIFFSLFSSLRTSIYMSKIHPYTSHTHTHMYYKHTNISLNEKKTYIGDD